MRFTGVLKIALQWTAALMLLSIVLIVLSNVFFRYFLHIGWGWTEEAARFLLIAMTFVAAAIAVKDWGHFRLLLIEKWIPENCNNASCSSSPCWWSLPCR